MRLNATNAPDKSLDHKTRKNPEVVRCQKGGAFTILHEKTNELKLELLLHSPDSPHMTVGHHYMFAYARRVLQGKGFRGKDRKVELESEMYFAVIYISVSKKGVQTLEKRWTGNISPNAGVIHRLNLSKKKNCFPFSLLQGIIDRHITRKFGFACSHVCM